MTAKRIVLAAFAILFSIGCLTASAGGWSVATIDRLPDTVAVNQPVSVGFTVLAHGRTPVKDEKISAYAVNRKTGTTVEFTGRQLKAGSFEVELNFPEAGRWRWVISCYGSHPMPDIRVEADTASELRTHSAATRGERLFIAKGCVRCHQNDRLDYRGRPAGIDGPDLTRYRADRDFISRWLKDPAATRNNALMPDLDLSEQEIDALVAYLNSGPVDSPD